MSEHALVALLIRAGALRFGEFTLKDGTRSPFFINLGDVASGADLLALGEHLADGIARFYPEATCLFGPAYKGFTLTTATAIALARRGKSLKVFYDRKEAKTHGEGGMFFGATPSRSDSIVVIDDVTTSGATKLESADKIKRAFGVSPCGVLVVVDRRTMHASTLPMPLAALLSVRDIVAALQAQGDTRASVVEAFLNAGLAQGSPHSP
jgi:orotate phosphoribosyltransferase